jgi:hypothetical protein
MKNLIYQFYSGKISLWKSYWLVGEILNGLFYLFVLNIEIRFFGNNTLGGSFPYLNFENFNFLNKILLLAWTIFISIGIWRAAEKYTGNLIWIFLTLIFLSYRVFGLRILFF